MLENFPTLSSSTQSQIERIERENENGDIVVNNREIITTTTSQNVGDRVVDVSLIPFARQRFVIVEGSNLRPDTDYLRLYWGLEDALDQLDSEIYFGNFVDNNGNAIGLSENWDQWKGSTATNLGFPAGEQTIQFIKTDSNGYFKCGIRVPANVPIGQHTLEVIEQGDIFAGIGGKDTRANTTYQAYGLNQNIEPTIVTTQVVEIRDNWEDPPNPVDPPPPPPPPDVQEPDCPPPNIIRVVPTGPTTSFEQCMNPVAVDPLAQSIFTYAEPTYVSSIDLYFKTKASSGAGITIQFREMINGYPGPKIIPGSTVTKFASDINTSLDASTKTTFTFNDPVYLEANSQYCFVVMAFSTEYELWCSELGQTDITTGNIIDRQPVLGSLFESQNNVTWTAEQNFDIKFQINKCNFSTDGTNESIEFKPMTGADAYALIQKTSQLLLGTEQIIHPNTDIKWYYRFDQTQVGTGSSQGLTSEWRLFKPGINLDLQNLTGQVLLRVDFLGGTLSPVIDTERAGVVFLKNLNEGTYVSRTMKFTSISPENLRPNHVRVLFDYKLPTNCAITPYMAINGDLTDPDNINWRQVLTIDGSGVTKESATIAFSDTDASADTMTLSSTQELFNGLEIDSFVTAPSGAGAGPWYIHVISDTLISLHTNTTDAGTGNSPIDLTVNSETGSFVRKSYTTSTTSVMPGGWTEAHFDYDFSAALSALGSDGINQFKF